MGISKKKIRKAVKGTAEEFAQTLENKLQADKAKQQALVSANNQDLFTANVSKVGLKAQREKLRADRFKQIQHSKTSKTEQVLVKRLASKMQNRERMGLEPVPKKQKTTANPLNQTDLEDLQDLWGSPSTEAKSKKFQEFKEGFAKKDLRPVKAVILPKGGHSYNPNIKDHKSLLKEVAQIEETLVEKELKDLQKLKPFTYGAADVQITQAEDEVEEYDSEDSDSSEQVDLNQNLSTNKPVDRLDIKTQAQRNKEVLNRAKLQ